MKKFAIILSGSGVYDGSEIHETVLTMLAVKKQKADYKMFAPNTSQYHVVNHLTSDIMKETRNVLVESARIARGDIYPLSDFKVEDIDAVIIPGGFGAAKNLSTFAIEGEKFTILPEIEDVLIKTHDAGKPIGALCIAPVILAKIFGDVKLTIGNDEKTASTVEKLGAIHLRTSHGQIVVDHEKKIYTTPCYMLDANLIQIESGIGSLVSAMLENM